MYDVWIAKRTGGSAGMKLWRVNPVLLATLAVVIVTTCAYAQGRGRGGAPQPPLPAKAAAPIDVTGYWVSIITEDWRYRMLTPPKGDFVGVPLNPLGRKVANEWDPAKDEASGEQCKAYGAANIMRLPGRLHITWQDDETLKVETDTGMQTRLFYFGTPQGEGGGWQGISKASWDFLPAAITSTDGARANRGRADRSGGSLKVVTTKLKAGYLRKNGVPYSANAMLSEYYDLAHEPNGDTYLVITTTIEDPMYLTQPFLTSQHFKKQADATGWNPTPCEAK
jgi:hypothetical protein